MRVRFDIRGSASVTALFACRGDADGSGEEEVDGGGSETSEADDGGFDLPGETTSESASSTDSESTGVDSEGDPICGNASIEGDEQCDDGEQNGTAAVAGVLVD